MKNLIILTVFSYAVVSCQVHLPDRREYNKRIKEQRDARGYIDTIKSCTDDFMKQHGVDIEKAFKICQQIYRRE